MEGQLKSQIQQDAEVQFLKTTIESGMFQALRTYAEENDLDLLDVFIQYFCVESNDKNDDAWFKEQVYIYENRMKSLELDSMYLNAQYIIARIESIKEANK